MSVDADSLFQQQKNKHSSNALSVWEFSFFEWDSLILIDLFRQHGQMTIFRILYQENVFYLMKVFLVKYPIFPLHVI
jgi:hypothetical protein